MKVVPAPLLQNEYGYWVQKSSMDLHRSGTRNNRQIKRYSGGAVQEILREKRQALPLEIFLLDWHATVQSIPRQYLTKTCWPSTPMQRKQLNILHAIGFAEDHDSVRQNHSRRKAVC